MFNRYIASSIAESQADTPVILLSGARQTGKSTLMQTLANRGGHTVRYLTLDEPATYAAAHANPHAFIQGQTGTLLIDEVQRVPELLLAIKHAVDQDRRAGRFLLTGSANVMLLPRVSESLAGRMEILTLYPLSQMEMTGGKPCLNLIDRWFERGILQTSKTHTTTIEDFEQRIFAGGYPEAVARQTTKRRAAWFESYLITVLGRDVRDIAQIEAMSQIPALLKAVAQRTTGSLNLADISRTQGIAHTSLKRYLTLLETVYLIEPIPAWTHRESQRAQKAPKYYLNDSALFAHVMGVTPKDRTPISGLNGGMVETFVHAELKKHVSWSDTRVQLLHYRTSTGIEVDFVLEDKQGNVVGIEVKSSLVATTNDFKGLKHLRELLGKKFVRGILLHPGTSAVNWEPDLTSMPMGCFWNSP